MQVTAEPHGERVGMAGGIEAHCTEVCVNSGHHFPVAAGVEADHIDLPGVNAEQGGFGDAVMDDAEGIPVGVVDGREVLVFPVGDGGQFGTVEEEPERLVLGEIRHQLQVQEKVGRGAAG